MKDHQFRAHAYRAGKALCEYIEYQKILEQSPSAPSLEDLYSSIASYAATYYKKLKELRNKILKKVKKYDKDTNQFSLIRDRHAVLPFLLAGFALVYEYSVPFHWLEEAFDSLVVKEAHMNLKTAKTSASRVGRRSATRYAGTGVAPKGSRENNVEISDINNVCIYSYARFRNENPTLPEKVVFSHLFSNYIQKAFENAAVMWLNERPDLGISREQVVADVRSFVTTNEFKEFLPESHKDIKSKITCHEQVGRRAWQYCEDKYCPGTWSATNKDDDAVSVAGQEDQECSLPCQDHDHPAMDTTPLKREATERPETVGTEEQSLFLGAEDNSYKAELNIVNAETSSLDTYDYDSFQEAFQLIRRDLDDNELEWFQ